MRAIVGFWAMKKARTFALLLFALMATLAIPIRTGFSAEPAREAREVDEGTAAPQTVSLKLLPPEAWVGRNAAFEFKNLGREKVEISGFGPPKDNRFNPSFFSYEIFRDGRWEKLPVYYDGLAITFSFEPGVQCIFDISLAPYKTFRKQVACRINLGDKIYSESFMMPSSAEATSPSAR